MNIRPGFALFQLLVQTLQAVRGLKVLAYGLVGDVEVDGGVSEPAQVSKSTAHEEMRIGVGLGLKALQNFQRAMRLAHVQIGFGQSEICVDVVWMGIQNLKKVRPGALGLLNLDQDDDRPTVEPQRVELHRRR